MSVTWFRRVLVATALAGGAMAFSTGSASAAFVDDDPVTVSGYGVDFGSTSGVIGFPDSFPVSSGNVRWTQSSTSLTARLTGRVYYDDYFTGGCARVRFSTYDANDNHIKSLYSGSACRGGSGNVVGKNVDLTVSAPNAHRARVVTEVSYNGGASWATVNAQNAYLGNG